MGCSPWGREESDMTEQPHMECYLPGFLSPEFKSVTSAGWHFSFIRLSFTEGLIEKAMAPYSSTLAWKIAWTEEPGGLQSMGSRRVGHD